MLEKKVFFEIVALHSCQLRIRLKHLVTTCDFNNLCSKSVALQLVTIWKKKIICWCFSRISAKKIKNFQNTFCWLLSLHWKNNRKGKLKCLLHTALISNAFFDEIRIKESGTLCLWRNETEDSVFIKIEGAFGKFCFWLSISNFWQKQKQKIRVYGGFRTHQICLSCSFCLIMDRGVGELRSL